MKRLKTVLIMTLYFAFIITTTTITPNYSINSCEHYTNNGEEF